MSSCRMRSLVVCILLTGLSQAVQVYLHPQDSLPPILSPERATLALSRHLGLELFESAGDYGESFGVHDEQTFVGQGDSNGLMLSLKTDGFDVKDVLPDFTEPTFTLSNSPTISSLSGLVSSYLHRASHAYTSIYTSLSTPPSDPSRILDPFTLSPSPATKQFIEELTSLSSYLESPSTSKFGAWDLTGLSQIALTHETESEEYRTASQAMRAALSAATKENIKLALLTYTSQSPINKREPPQAPFPSPPPQQPIGSVSTCFTSSDACTNATNNCTGRGECAKASKAGRTCFVCTCVTTVSEKGKKETWVGEMCERKDISGPFVLITGTVIGLLLLIGGSIALLYSIGGHELPSTLLGSTPGDIRKQ